jgi:hypothetical protein
MCYESEMQLIRASYLRKQKVTSTALPPRVAGRRDRDAAP